MTEISEPADLYSALSAAQAEIRNPTKDKTAKVQTKGGGAYAYSYADIADVLEGVRPVLSKHGLSILQLTTIDGDVMVLRTRLAHKSGQSVESDYPVCRIGVDHQQMGAALTYARRYALCPMLGIAADSDTDANGAAEPAKRGQPAHQIQPRSTNDEPASGADALAYLSEWQTYIDNEESEQAIRETWSREKPQRVAAGLTEPQVAVMMQSMKKRFEELRSSANLMMAGE